jgi:hypothetical protein
MFIQLVSGDTGNSANVMQHKTGSSESHNKLITNSESIQSDDVAAAPPEIETCPVSDRRAGTKRNRFRRWFFEGIRETSKQDAHTDKWYRVMTLTGVDYFSTLGYSPGISYLAAGLLSPFATVILVLLTLFGALPVYNKVAEESPHGQGSISMLERLMPRWKGKMLVLCLLGFAATSWIVTITLSAADAATHLIQNPFFPDAFKNQMGVTIFMLIGLGAVFLKGFREAIGVCVWTVGIYLFLNVLVIGAGLREIFIHPETLSNWSFQVWDQHKSIVSIVVLSALLFPKLALGLSGFETGVAVMPHVAGNPEDKPDKPTGRIKNTKKLLISAALIMSVFLIGSSLVTTVLIPPAAFQPGGLANGRALAFLAHKLMPPGFETIYDASTVAILWFAGASAMAGLLNLVPRYLPRYGMAPNWARATRPLVVFFTIVSIFVTCWFKADVDAQGGAYATGVLMLMTSAALAASLVVWKTDRLKCAFFSAITAVFIYTTAINASERPDGLRIAAVFVVVILISSLISRILRSTELRIQNVKLDDTAKMFIKDALAANGAVRIVAHRPGGILYSKKEREARDAHNIDGDFMFLEVSVGDASEYVVDDLEVHGVLTQDGYRILRCESAAVPNTIAALLIYIRDWTNSTPHLYVGWTEGNPVVYILKYLFFGEGETAPVTREILRETEKDPTKRPRVHVG